MSLADDLDAPPLARRVAEIIRRHAAEIEAPTEEWTLMAALRVLVEVGREREVSNGEGSTDAPPLDTAVEASNGGASTGLGRQYEIAQRRLRQIPAVYR